MDWQKIVIHHSASPTEVRRSGKNIPVDAAIIREWHQAKGWRDLGYHFVIMPDGRWEEGRPLWQPGAHCKVGQRNFIGIGICLVGDFSAAEVPKSQLVGLVNKVTQLMTAFHLKLDDIELHRDVPMATTECPGRCFPEQVLRTKLKENYRQ
jgi:N-acetyl-anhydromuramyl-L-alanine amidase AmpD